MSLPARTRTLGAGALAVVAWGLGVAAADAARARAARNVILMVADGAGYNTWKATSMYVGTTGKEFHDTPGWVELATSTHALRQHAQPGVGPEHARVPLPALAYDPLRVWDPRPAEGGEPPYPWHFAGYRWLIETASESAATITSLVTGVKTYSGAINVDGAGAPLETIADVAHGLGKRVGTVSSVPFTHATPAAGGGVHNANRGAYCALAIETLTGVFPDFVAGCGNPDFDNNGVALADDEVRDHQYVGGKEVWGLLQTGAAIEPGFQACLTGETGIELTAERIAALRSWTLVEGREQIEALASGPTPPRALIVPEVGWASFWNGRAEDPARPLGVRLGGALQQQRGSRADAAFTAPGYDPLLEGVPTLETLTRVALNALDDDPDGFFLLVEGGAVDWAMHANQMGRMIEEMLDFRRSIDAVIAWIEAHGGWEATLLVVTSDHDHLLWGPNADTIPFDPLVDNGAGKLPSYRWLSNHHSNALVPLFARGVGAEQLAALATGADPIYGRYADQTDVYRVMSAAFRGSAP